MADALFILIVVAFFGLMVLLVKACDHIIGPDELTSTDRSADGSVDAGADVGTDPAEATR
jgi:uncharacterized iron-regulated membrane protein